MRLRAKSRSQQWARWLYAAVVGLAVYVILSRILYGSMSWNVFQPGNQRIFLPILAIFWLFALETRWDGVEREKKVEVEGQGQRDGVEEGLSALTAGQSVDATSSSRQKEEELAKPVLPVLSRADCDGNSCPLLPLRAAAVRIRGGFASASKEETSSDRRDGDVASTSDFRRDGEDDGATGEALFDKARTMRHQRIPDLDRDSEYISLLARSAAKGHSPALVKLGEYAMRRAAWVEAYYWINLAQRNGMHGLTPVLRKIRKKWAENGFPRQSSNVNEFFTAEAGALGRALLRIDSGREAAKAREFLKAHHPEFCA